MFIQLNDGRIINLDKTAKIKINGVEKSNIKIEDLSDVTFEYVAVGKTLQLDANVLPLNATINEVFWTSSDETVATVNNGVISALKLGTTTITATFG